MSRFFVEPNEREPIYEFDPATTMSDTAPNVVWIRPRMSVGIENKVKGAIAHLDTTGQTVEIDLGANLTELLVQNILAWEGPDFLEADGRKIPVTRANIERLIGRDPFIERVADEIAKRNKKAASPDPKSPDTNGSTNGDDGYFDIPTSTVSPSVSMISTSSSRKSSIGHPNK